MKYLLTVSLFMTAVYTVNAQKLPKIQEASVYAPDNIKIDGKLTEWNDQFQAYNPGNVIYYTVSNDDNNLYLTVRMEDMLGIRKVFKGGLTFTIIPSSKTTDRLAITFPVTSENRTSEMEGGEIGPLYHYRILKPAEKTNKAKTDPLVSSANNAVKNYKEIHVTGMPGISDPLISIYNPQGIKVAAGFDNKMEYTYELAIPLKYLEAAISDVKSLKYNIKLRTFPFFKEKNSAQPSNPPLILGKYAGPGSPNDQFLYNDTDFSGEYKLAKKK